MTGEALTGERVRLRPFAQHDLRHLRQWYDDAELRGLIGATEPLSAEQAQRWFEGVCTDQQRLWFAIEVKDDGRVIGECGLLRMFPAWGTTDLSIIIGERDARSQGYGLEAIRLLLAHAFEALRFHRVAIGVVGFNARALRFHEKVGFQREGVQRDGYLHNGRYHDFVMLSLLEDEFGASGGD